MCEEELPMLLAIVKVMRREDGGQDRDVRFQLRLHQTGDNRLRDELMAIDAAIDDKRGADDRGIPAALRQGARQQWYLEGAGQANTSTIADLSVNRPISSRNALRHSSTMSACQRA
jgi:hypothetical protein